MDVQEAVAPASRPPIAPSILFVDPYSQVGHINFNRGYVERLQERGFSVRLAVKEGYAASLGMSSQDAALSLPLKYFDEGAGPVRARYNLLRIQSLIRRHLQSTHYAVVMFAAFEEISLYLSGLPSGLLLVFHADVSALSNPIKRFFLNRLGARNTFLVFHERFGRRCREFGIPDVMVEPHGLSTPIVLAQDLQRRLLGSIDPRLSVGKFRTIVFAPAGSKFGDTFLAAAIANREFFDFLSERDILLVIKDQGLRSTSRNVLVLRQYLTIPQYQALFLASAAVLLQYPPEFDRISGILFECFSNHKPCLLSEIECFRAFEDHFCYRPYYSSVAELMSGICGLLDAGKAPTAPYRYLERLVPSFTALLDRYGARSARV